MCLSLYFLHRLLSLLSTDSAKQAQIREVRGYFTLHTHVPVTFPSSVLVCCMVQLPFASNKTIYCLIYMQHFLLLSSCQMPSPFGAGTAHEKKIGHRRVDASGETTYKKVGFPLYPSPFFFSS